MKWHTIWNATPVGIWVCYAGWLVAAAVVCINCLGTQTIFEHANASRPYSLLLNDVLYGNVSKASGSADVICFGDSNFYFYPIKVARSGDFDLHLTGLIRTAVAERGVRQELTFSEWAFPAANMFDYYCLVYEAVKLSPDLIVVPINWRAFS